jgi:recombination protein RecT
MATTVKPQGSPEIPGAESTRALTASAKLPAAMVQTMQGLMPHVPALLPPDISTEQFRAALYLELSGRRDLADCTQDSLRECVIKAAMHGLLPGRDCHILPFRNKGQGGRRTATYIPNYFGVILALERTGKVAKAFAHPVYTGDEFVVDYLADVYKHIPAVTLGKQPGDLRFFYGCVRMKDGTTHIEVMDEAAIDAVRRRSPAHEHGPWVDDYLMMARKTALKRVCKYVRLTPEQQQMLDEDQEREREDIPPDRHRQNIVDLFGDDPRGSTPVEVDSVTGEIRPPGGNDPQPKTVRKAAGASQVASSTTPVTPQAQGEASGNLGHSAQKDGFAWTTLRAHREDTHLPPALLEQIASALSPVEPATDAEADALASQLLSFLDSLDE